MTVTFSDGYAAQLFGGAGAIFCYAVLGLILLLGGFYAVDVTTPGRLTKIIRADRNSNAIVLAGCGMAAIALIVVASIWASGGNLAEGLIATLLWGAVGILAQVISFLIFRALLGIDVAALMKESALDPATVLLGVMQVAMGAVTAISVI